ncbi:MAG: hypothetical protein BWY82_02687 [Verrucomicrobia bacterium ADurb.Bin474]|nr:MAG: hypothetical protein BWY82_02687 [Verrucomicrobia bacterium ADurb.Bin474]
MNRDNPSDPENGEDPWASLTPEENRRAQRHLRILYGAMILMIVGPLVLLIIFGRR